MQRDLFIRHHGRYLHWRWCDPAYLAAVDAAIRGNTTQPLVVYRRRHGLAG